MSALRLASLAISAIFACALAPRGALADDELARVLAEAPSFAPAFLGDPSPRPRAAPKRIVTVAPSATELVVALGAASRIVGVSRFDELPEVRALPRVGGFLDPNLEVIVAMRPELVIGVPNAGARPVLERLVKLGIPVLVLPGNTFSDVFHAARALAPVLGPDAVAKVEPLLAKVERDVRALTVAVNRERAPRVAFVYGWRPLVLAGPGSFADTMLKLLNAKNVVASGSAYPQYALEKLLEDRPDVIIDASEMGDAGAERSPWARFETIPAVTTGRVHRVRAQDLLVPAPRIVAGLETLAALLHPKAAAR
ncbi:helical backbone metal receptor [Myxococcota bacterium]|nr:helical backbone metal receptor [Myxococcota bacterium]